MVGRLVIAGFVILGLSALSWFMLAAGLPEWTTPQRGGAVGNEAGSAAVVLDSSSELVSRELPSVRDDSLGGIHINCLDEQKRGVPALLINVSRVLASSGQSSHWQIRSDEGGVATIGDLQPGAYHVQAPDGPGLQVDVVAGTQVAIEYAVTSVATIHCVVVDQAGSRVPDAMVHGGYALGEARAPVEWALLGQSDAAGQLVVRMRTPCVLRASTGRGVSSLPVVVEHRESEVLLSLPSSGLRVACEVRSDKGEAIEGALIELGRGACQLEMGHEKFIQSIASGKTGRDGRCVLEVLWEPRIGVLAACQGFASSSVELYPADRSMVECQLVLGAGCTVRGLVSEEGGERVSQALVFVSRSKVDVMHLALDHRMASKEWSVSHCLSDEQGRFELTNVSPGQVFVVACKWESRQAGNGSRMRSWAQVSELLRQGEDSVIDVTLKRMHEMEVMLVAEGGKPQRDVFPVVVMDAGGVSGEATWLPGLLTPRESGLYYRMGPLSSGPHRVIVETRDETGNSVWIEQDVDIPCDKVQRITVPARPREPRRVVTGVVVDRSGLLSWRDKEWSVQMLGGKRIFSATRTGWLFRVDAAGGGSFRLGVMAAGRPVYVSGVLDLPLEGHKDVGELVVELGGAVEVECAGPLDDIKGRMVIGDGLMGVELRRTGATFRAEDLPPGEHVLRWYSDSIWREPRIVKVISGVVTKLSISGISGKPRSLLVQLPAPSAWQTAELDLVDRLSDRRESLGLKRSQSVGWKAQGWEGALPDGQWVLRVKWENGDVREFTVDWADRGLTRLGVAR